MSNEPRKRILVVDDEEDVQILVCRILRDVGYEVEAVSDGAEGIRKIEASRPDLVILDLMMPNVDGWGVLKHFRSSDNRPPIVVLTARTDYETFTRGVREGASAYVCKPFRFHELVATCQAVLLQAGADKPAPAAERRREPRRQIMVEVNVLSRERHPIALGELVNLSAGGAQVDLGIPIEPGDAVRLAFRVPGEGSPLSLEGRVQWRGPSLRGYAHGLAFASLTPEEKRRIAELLAPPG